MLKKLMSIMKVCGLCSVVVGLVFYWADVSAQGVDSVEGDFFVDNQVVIQGSGFGVHDDYGGEADFLNYIFEDCENGVLVKSPKWESGYAKITSANNRSGSSFNLFNERRATSEVYTNAFGETVDMSSKYGIKTDVENVALVHKYFYSMWISLSENFGLIQGVNDGTGAKVLMNTPIDGGAKDYFALGSSDILGEPKLNLNWENGCQAETVGAANTLTSFGTWHRMDIFISIPDATTGYTDKVVFWLDGKLLSDPSQSGTNCSILFPNPEDVQKLGLIGFMGYMYNGTDIPFYINTDDFYLDFTLARVEVSDSPVWDEAKAAHKEIQVPTAWADNSITVKVNRGSLGNNQNLYLYVINSDGVPVNTVGYVLGAGNVVPPSSVKDFKLN